MGLRFPYTSFLAALKENMLPGANNADEGINILV